MTLTIRLVTRGVAGSLIAVAAAAALSGCGTQDVTKARLERSLGPTFAHLYVQRAAILGESGITVASTAATPTCDRGGPKVADVGPGADWICMVTFRDDHGQQQEGKVEVQVHADSTYVAGGPSKLIGPNMITDSHGKDVPNPVFEFDGAFDPDS